MPAYVQLLPEGRLSPLTDSSAPPQPASMQSSSSSAAAAAAAPSLGAGHAQQSAVQLETGPCVAQATQAELERGMDSQLQAVMRAPGFQVFAEYVLEGALLSLMQESAAGDWEGA
eukprot:scaffold47241_cov19-Tisochrysis_lutea.AAC.1